MMKENVYILFLLSGIWYLKDINTHSNIQCSKNKKMWSINKIENGNVSLKKNTNLLTNYVHKHTTPVIPYPWQWNFN